MADNIIIISNESTTDAGQSIIESCLPERIECCPTPKGGQFADNPWNCLTKKSTDRDYYIPYKKGDKIQFQTLVFGGTRTNPSAYDSLVTVEICLPDGSTTSISGTKMSAWKNGRPYQIIEINTSGINSNCWNLKFTLADDPVPCYSQHYKEIDCNEDQYLCIRSIMDYEDCFKLCYGKPDSFVGTELEFDNSMKIRASIRCTSFSVPKSENLVTGEEYIDGPVVNTYTIRMFGKFPLFIKSILSKQLLYGKYVVINGKEYKTGSVSSSNKISDNTNMWRGDFNVTDECENSKSSKSCL